MKNVVITGSTRGLGFYLARQFLMSGCNVTVSGRYERSLMDAGDELGKYSEKLFLVKCDVRDRNDIENLWNASKEKWGKIDIWINNAGQNCPYEFIYDTDQADVDSLVDTNIKGVIFGSQIAARGMISQGYGQIWNIEGLGSNNMIQEKTILYGASKHALTYLAKGLAKELTGTGVFSGRLSPGMMLTDFITKTCDGAISPVLGDKRFLKIFRILADRPETVAPFLVRKMLANKKNGTHIVWLTNGKAMLRFLSGRKLDMGCL